MSMQYGEEFKKYATKHMGINSLTVDTFMSQFKGGAPTSAAIRADYISPTIIEERQLNIATMDVFSRLMMDRIIFLGYPINDEVANIVTAQLPFLESTDRTRDIQMYINSPGGSVYSGLGVYDTMQYITPDVSTICIGMAASMGAVLLTAGGNGKRTALKHSRIMMHQPSGGMGGTAADIAIQAEQMLYTKRMFQERVSYHTGQTRDQIEADSDRDRWFTAEEAKGYGFIDQVITGASQVPEGAGTRN